MRKLCLGALALVLAAPASVSAAPITFAFTGTVDGFLVGSSPSIGVGDPLSGTVTFEANTPDINPDPSEGRYAGALLAATVAFPTGTFLFDFVTGEMACDLPFDPNCGPLHTGSIAPADGPLVVVAPSGAFPVLVFGAGIQESPSSFFNFALQVDLPDGALLDDGLPMVPPSLAPTVSQSQLQTTGTSGMIVLWSTDSLTLVPEPSTALLLSIGLVALATKRRRFQTAC